MEGRIGRRVSRGMLPLLALHTLSEYYRLERKPPVTAGLIAANTLIYLRPGVLDAVLPSIHEVWFNPHLILKHRDLRRFFLSAFYHVGEPHLVYNMLSLLWKGIQLEISMGSVEFASMVASLLALSQGITLMLAKSLLLFFDYERAYYSEYAVGFSGVLFAMKVVLNNQSENLSYVHGVIVPSRYAAWAELILIQMFVPGVSFLGHLGGILAGLLYLRLKGTYSGSDPLTIVITGLTGVFKWPVRFIRNLFRRDRIYGRGTVGGNRTGRASQSGIWRCQACTYDNSGLLSICEMCGTSQSGTGFSSHQLVRNSRDLPLEELRRLRLERFGR
ncbi:Rhomboid-like protein [Quillaja saponaria]|uniref:Rhomboid-like protein n=1 Tax=Quillaja saponaria TaxID=32244 RepID=A0AAD7LC23_QUISA|nr:Rhomboid-like protein [Quillaja saponaria]KAJ7955354.1 Rhomboid-like protein [Quillaja saponaria]